MGVGFRSRYCQRYRATGKKCSRPLGPGADWCGVCAGYTSPTDRVADHIRASLAHQAQALVDLDAPVDPRVEDWAQAAAAVDAYAVMTDSALDEAIRRPHVDLPALVSALSEAELRGRPGVPDLVERVASRRSGLEVVHRNALGQGPDPAWQSEMVELGRRLDEDRERLYKSLAGDDGDVHETEGRWAASLAFEEAANGGAACNPEAFDAWVDLQMASGGYAGAAGRSRTRGYRSEVARLADLAYAGEGALAGR